MYKDIRIGNTSLNLGNKNLVQKIPYPTNGLIRRWTFDNSLDNTYGGTYPLTAPGTYSYVSGPGILKAIHFEWPNWVYDNTIYNPYIVSGSGLSLSFWNNNMDTSTSAMWSLSLGGASSFSHYVTPSNHTERVNLNGTFSDFGSVPSNTWTHHVINISFFSSSEVFINNQSVHTYGSFSSSGLISNMRLVINSLNYSGQVPMKNSYSNFYVYNRILTPSEINILYHEGIDTN